MKQVRELPKYSFESGSGVLLRVYYETENTQSGIKISKAWMPKIKNNAAGEPCHTGP